MDISCFKRTGLLLSCIAIQHDGNSKYIRSYKTAIEKIKPYKERKWTVFAFICYINEIDTLLTYKSIWHIIYTIIYYNCNLLKKGFLK